MLIFIIYLEKKEVLADDGSNFYINYVNKLI